MEQTQWFVYLLECGDGTFYAGVTNDVDKRMKDHARGKGSKYVYRKGFKRLIVAQPCKDKSKAYKAEYQIKKLPRDKKLAWFKSQQPIFKS